MPDQPKVPTPVVDKNGKLTTVHKNPERYDSPSRIDALDARIATRGPDALRKGDITMLRNLAADTRALFDDDSIAALEFEVGDRGGFSITRIVDEEQNDVWDRWVHGGHEGGTEGVDMLSYALGHVDFESGLMSGLIGESEEGLTYYVNFSDVEAEGEFSGV
jgi:hypothetical protein